MLPHVFAYLDLASGSMIVQAAIAGIVVVPVLRATRSAPCSAATSRPMTRSLLSETDSTAADAATDEAATDAAAADRS